MITKEVPPEKVGAVDEYAFPSRAQHSIAIRRVAEALRLPPEHLWETSKSFYESWGLPGSFPEVVQAGVLVLSPRNHKELCEHTYYTYEDRGDAIWNYEMRPFSFELLSNDLVHWIDRRFNNLWMYIKFLEYPWLFEKKIDSCDQSKGLAGWPSSWRRHA